MERNQSGQAQPVFLGVDVGSTKTHAMLADASGRIFAMSAGGCGNHELVGYDGLAAVLRQSVGSVLASAGLERAAISAAGFGVAGYDWPSERAPTLAAIATLGLSCPLDAVNDTIIGLLAGASQGWGVVIDAGTGNNVRGRDRTGRGVQVTGCGERFGEFGGAYDVVRRAVQIVSHAWAGRGEPTRLTAALLAHTGARDAEDLIDGLSLGRYRVEADAAPLVFAEALQGDRPAQEAIRWVATEQAETACGVIRKLGIERMDFEVVLIGSTFDGGALYLEPLKERIAQTAPQARFVRLAVSPVVGGVLLAMQAAGLDPSTARCRLLENAAAIRENPA